ncbi:type II toxin-antitoxin system prevent-host-death family antitoxin [Latilactobacillus graminis]|uniref:Antitoxin n=2 Tax=Latilactobacillus graminis TaxID=60519 RepID=A0AA89L4X2_9LACO|nr:type II toxin-antitoxin system prevent-host-death family antitoxin [Latilactobacillus graminis]KRM23361.1 hypothetical protein FC90_GL000315 [Latilactobacillus graminis DSM 20719]QFP80286.1 type II toxin-antitoxin system Phd/YefM family antitoxin [Latilactobacillus graminis]
MLREKIQALYAKKMLQQIIKEVNVKPLIYEIVDANGAPTAVLLSYEQWQKIQTQITINK